jgi:hypothetical protein
LRAQPSDYGGIGGGNPLVGQAGAAGHSRVGNVDDVLHAEWNALQRPSAPLADARGTVVRHSAGRGDRRQQGVSAARMRNAAGRQRVQHRHRVGDTGMIGCQQVTNAKAVQRA